MKYFEKELPGFTVIYLHNSDECHNCQLALKSDSDFEIPEKYDRKKRRTSKRCFSENFKPLKNIILEAQKIFESSEFKFSLPLKPCTMKPLKKRKKKKEVKALRKTGLIGGNSKTVKTVNKKKVLKTLKHIAKPATKKIASTGLTAVKKKSCNTDKVNGSKIPGKGTLKRKRWLLDKLRDNNDSYEDDIYEDQKFGHFQGLLEDETDHSEKYEDLKTPVFPFSISPRQRTPSPTYRDCYSPTQLSIYRKGAEEYQYRRRKRRKARSSETEEEASKMPTQNRVNDVQQRLEEVVKILNAQQIRNEVASDSEEDQYFSDIDTPCKVIP